MDYQDSIWIGPNLHIPCGEFDPRNVPVFEVDESLPYGAFYLAHNQMDQLLNQLETECVVGCCGIGALRFWPEDIVRATQQLDRALLLKEIISLQQRLLNVSEDIVVYHRLNQYFQKSTFLVLLDYLIGEITKNTDG